VSHINVTNNVVYAKPGVKPLKYDVYSPKGARNLPCIVLIHGGGWNANDEDIMRGLARELTKGGRFVVFSIDYRWAGKTDGDATNNTTPLSHIPKASERSVPQYLTRGTKDPLISNAAVTEFVDALVQAGQRVEYVQVGGASHAFFDWKPDAATKATFAKYGAYYAAGMKAFFMSVLY
jgi:acetyl esterase/lipase